MLSDEYSSVSGTPISTSTLTKGKSNKLNTNTNHTTHKPANDLKLLIMNTQSFKSKLESVGGIIDDESPVIIAFSETWLNNNIHNSKIMLSTSAIGRTEKMVMAESHNYIGKC